MSSHVVVMLLVDLVVILAAARILGWVAERVGQPAVVGEIAAGILAGPTVLGAHLSDAVCPMQTRPALTALADIGIALFMFVAGTETDLARLTRDRPGRAGGLSAGIIAAPLYSVLVVMALVTTAAIVPLLRLFGAGAGSELDMDSLVPHGSSGVEGE